MKPISKFIIAFIIIAMIASISIYQLLKAQHYQMNESHLQNIQNFDFIYHAHQQFLTMDNQLANYAYDGNFSENARLDMMDSYDIFTDYISVLQQDVTDEEARVILTQMMPFLAQWLLVRDKIFAGTADRHGIIPLSTKIDGFLSNLARLQLAQINRTIGQDESALRPFGNGG